MLTPAMFLKERGKLCVSYEEYKSVLERGYIMSTLLLEDRNRILKDGVEITPEDTERINILRNMLHAIAIDKYSTDGKAYIIAITLFDELYCFFYKYNVNLTVSEKTENIKVLHYEDLHNIGFLSIDNAKKLDEKKK